MQMLLQAIDNNLWYIVKNGVPCVTATITDADVKKFKQLDSQAKNIICGHLSKGHVTTKMRSFPIWDRGPELERSASKHLANKVSQHIHNNTDRQSGVQLPSHKYIRVHHTYNQSSSATDYKTREMAMLPCLHVRKSSPHTQMAQLWYFQVAKT